jgi:metallophosphoesterase (TIGR00282 family)
MTFNILFFGDVVGAVGRKALAACLPELRTQYASDLVVANVENLAHGAGVTAQTLQDLLAAGVDVFTGGNHSWDNPLGAPLFEDEAWNTKLVVPMNYGGAKSGQASLLIEKNSAKILIVNLMGRMFTHPDTTSPFEKLSEILATSIATEAQAILVDLHAEATGEKEAFGYFADGKVAAVLGTHTHVATADARLLPQGTAYVTDVGRCGFHQSVIGYDPKTVIPNFLAQNKQKYEIPRTGTAEVNGVAITVDLDTGRAVGLDRIRKFVDVLA